MKHRAARPGTHVSADASAPGGPAALEAVPVRHRGRWVAALAVLLVAAMAARSMAVNPRFQWDVVGQYLFDRAILTGLERTLELTVIAMVIGVVLGVVLAVMRLSPNPVVAGGSWVYVWFFRGTPVLVQLLFWNFLSALYPRLSLGVPFGPTLVSGSATALITTWTAAILGLGLNEAAYMAEIVRAGILSVDEGQAEAAQALGLTRLQVLRHIVLPQAMRVIIPPTGNETISMLKTTSLVSVIGYAELLYAAQIIYSRTYQTIPLLIAAAIWYLVATSVLTVGQYHLERRFGRGSSRNQAATMVQRLRASFAGRNGRGAGATGSGGAGAGGVGGVGAARAEEHR
ncbi:MAG: amino acid ABC transporter permease [Actinobacteria bacterium]|nr:amino acid ABC transporter permease [Actinomycetota bacterium]